MARSGEQAVDEKCEIPGLLSHYYNLNVPIDARPHQIKKSYLRLSKTIQPDKFRDPNQNAHALEAIKLVNEAYKVLSDGENRRRHREDYCPGRLGNLSSLSKDYEANRPFFDWDEKWNRGVKPWLWHYDPIQIRGCKYDDRDDEEYLTTRRFCTATWVNLVHLVVDNGLPTTISDNIWRRAQIWRDGKVNNAQDKLVTLGFQSGCSHFQLNITMKEDYTIPWSGIESNTDWPLSANFGEVFCPDILLLPLAITMASLFIYARLVIKILRRSPAPTRPVFWPPSAITSPHSEDSFLDGIMTQSQRQSQARSPQRRSRPTPSEQESYTDDEVTPQHSSKKSPQKPIYNASAVAKMSRSTNPPAETRNKPAEPSHVRVGTKGRSANPSEKSSPTHYHDADSQRQPSPPHPWQLLSLSPSEKHWYYSDPGNDSAHHLPLRERRRPLAAPEPLRTRYVHYEDEDYADDGEQTPRTCAALTASGRPCQRRVSMTSPLSGPPIPGLGSPLCFQHRHVRKWIGRNNEQEPPTPGRTPSARNSPALRKAASSGV
ncbi:hypothetical protein DSL72_005232 [Monilinia vaccinii-corymbosi]|uniref:J domain-containing protein n=1 Tax=Monilinia vaccinii-corymbosi TaxID=61207 RepID=A0A8A3PF38_9HELO|nr:hypothetical protein DSL72_005232 [Monilinia vaccinii-corymbosi]